MINKKEINTIVSALRKEWKLKMKVNLSDSKEKYNNFTPRERQMIIKGYREAITDASFDFEFLLRRLKF